MMWLPFLAADDPSPGITTPGTDMIWGLLPRPVAVALAIVVALSWVVADVTGKLGKLGPIYKAIRKKREENEKKQSGWRQRDAEVEVLKKALEAVRRDKDQRVEELKQVIDIVNGQVQMLTVQGEDNRFRLEKQQGEIQSLHNIADAQYQAIRRHMVWDREVVEAAREMGLDLPSPPTLFIPLDGVGDK